MNMTLQDFEKAHGLDNEPENPRAKMGGNQPPSPIERSADTVADLSKFLADEPIISTDVKAREAKTLIERARGMLDEMERHRDARVRPLNNQVAEINAEYKRPRTTLQTALGQLCQRANDYMDAEREKAAEIARKHKEEAERLIREAEDAIAAKREADDNASQGEIGIDTVSAAAEADEKIAAANKAIRESQRADRNTNIRIGGGFSGRALTQRTKETLIVTDWQKAITAIGFVDGIRDAVLTAARAYRKLKNELPDGVVSEKEKSL